MRRHRNHKPNDDWTDTPEFVTWTDFEVYQHETRHGLETTSEYAWSKTEKHGLIRPLYRKHNRKDNK